MVKPESIQIKHRELEYRILKLVNPGNKTHKYKEYAARIEMTAIEFDQLKICRANRKYMLTIIAKADPTRIVESNIPIFVLERIDLEHAVLPNEASVLVEELESMIPGIRHGQELSIR